MKKLISFIIKSEMGFLKKPDINDGIYLTYNMIHKPSILGILGAIIGLEGYKEVIKQKVEKPKKNSKALFTEEKEINNSIQYPEYYQKLQNIKIGIKPIGDDKGNFQKTVIKYNNNTGFANKGGANLMISEQTLISPSYKIYLLLDLDNEIESKLYSFIKEQKAEFLPYLGKNDFSLWWDKNRVEEYEFEKLEAAKSFSIDTIFKKEEAIVNHILKAVTRREFSQEKNSFFYFEKLPIGFNEKLFQYELADFAYTNAKLSESIKIESD
ncbi:hypothetical protein JXR93_09575, partial [bacterium]|nr:hypothetical protein [bacterium]